uniref:MHC class I-like antigen recognition-like domain-containing protein n=1 Tax=Oryzias melastigma TaxID=30732 RepID=A0A3B3CMC8_ORYME
RCFGIFQFFSGSGLFGRSPHSLKFFDTAPSQVPNFPEFVTVFMIDDVQVTYFDSNIKVNLPKQNWMKEAKDLQDWEKETGALLAAQQTFITDIEVLKPRFNQTEGLHVYQRMCGCEWDDETGEVKSYYQFGYDGEDFINLDQKQESWVAPKQKAVVTKHSWENDTDFMSGTKTYLVEICPEWLKKYLEYGKSSLIRTGKLS